MAKTDDTAVTGTAATGTAATGTADEPSSAVTVGRAVKLAGEAITPGASLILDGKLKLGLMHALAAGVARAVLGPIGIGLVALNSYSKSTSGKHLYERLSQKTS